MTLNWKSPWGTNDTHSTEASSSEWAFDDSLVIE